MTHVRDTARRLASLLLLGPSLDTNYAATTITSAPWPAATAAAPETSGGTAAVESV